MYSADFDKLREQNLPFLLRKPVFQAFISVLMATLVRLHSEFTAFKTEKDIRLAHSGQVRLLERILNDTFDDTLRRITVVNEVIPDDNYIANKNNANQSYIAAGAPSVNQFYVGNQPVYFGQYDFVVSIPSAISGDELLIRRMVSEYKQAGKGYDINVIT